MIENLKNFITGLKFINTIWKYLFPKKETTIEVNSRNKITVKGNENITGSNNVVNNGSLTYNTYLQQDISNKAKEKLINEIENIISLIKPHCSAGYTFSSKSDSDKSMSDKLKNIEGVRKEVDNIDTEILDKLKDLNNAITVFDSYVKNNEKVINDLKSFHNEIEMFRSQLTEFVWNKFIKFSDANLSNFSNKAEMDIQKNFKIICDKKERILEELKRV